jgi:hypothetical protein
MCAISVQIVDKKVSIEDVDSPKKKLIRQGTPFALAPPRMSDPDIDTSFITEDEGMIPKTSVIAPKIGGTESEILFFQNLDKKIASGPDYIPEEDPERKKMLLILKKNETENNPTEDKSKNLK